MKLRPSQSARTLDAKPFLQVSLHTASDVQDEGVRHMALMLLKQLDEGAEVPGAMRSQVPLFADACDRLGVLRLSTSYKKLTALSLREGRRNALIMLDRDRLLSACADLGVDAVEIRGPMLGQTYYPSSDLRHTHALKVAIFDLQAHETLVVRLQQDGWRTSPFTKSTPGYREVLTSPAGVEAELYQRLLPYTDHMPEQMGSIEFQIAMVLCQTHFEPQHATMRWLCDMTFVFATTPIDEDVLASMIDAFGMAGSCAHTLRDAQNVLRGSDESTPRKVVAGLLRRLNAAHCGTPRNTPEADAALRAYAPAPRGPVRRALSALKRAIASRTVA